MNVLTSFNKRSLSCCRDPNERFNQFQQQLEQLKEQNFSLESSMSPTSAFTIAKLLDFANTHANTRCCCCCCCCVVVAFLLSSSSLLSS